MTILNSTYPPIADYSIIGNMETCALVNKHGSIDWCCLPHLESPSVFARMLDWEKGGRFSVHPVEDYQSSQQYIENTNILQTRYERGNAALILTDFLPIARSESREKYSYPAIFRKLHCQKQPIKVIAKFQPRFNFAQDNVLFDISDTRIHTSTSDESLFPDSQMSSQINNNSVIYEFTIEPGDDIWFVLRYGKAFPFEPAECETSLQSTIDYWHTWVHSCDMPSCIFNAPWHDTVVRSGLILKLLTHEETGAIFATPPTSLPESIGGRQNWDYRFNWIRDASFAIQAFHHLGHVKEARDFLNWFQNIRRQTETPDDRKIRYSAHGNRNTAEQELSHLAGYRNSKPVRIGNSAANQWQLDIYGGLINSVYELDRYDTEIEKNEWDLIEDLVNYVSETWDTKDAGIWEFRDKPQHFVYSKLMSWVAVDRGIKIAEQGHFDAPLASWRHTRTTIKETILNRGFNKKLNSFVMYFDSGLLDASTLLIPLMGLLPHYDPRVKGTIEAIRRDLTTESGLVIPL